MIRAFVALGAAIVFALPAAAQDATGCGSPPSLQRPSGQLPKLQKAVRDNAPVHVLVLATTMGSGLKGMDQSYPVRFQAYLQKRLPKLPLTVATAVSGGDTAKQMLHTLKIALLSKPDLVIWQTGTVDAVQQLDPARFSNSLSDGRTLVRDAGAELVLIGPQFSRKAGALVEFQPYIDEMAHMEQAYDAPLLDRFSIMRYWADRGLVNLDGARETWAASAAFVHDCMGMFLVDVILKAAGIDGDNP